MGLDGSQVVGEVDLVVEAQVGPVEVDLVAVDLVVEDLVEGEEEVGRLKIEVFLE